MIVVIEGPSAVGKTTWCRSHFPEGFVGEAPENIDAPDLYANPVEIAKFWIDFNAGLWQRALQIETQKGIAICDGDPLRLYFSRSLWKSGAISGSLFATELPLYRRAIEEGRLGFADLVLWREAPVEELRRRAKSDPARRRRRHETYLRLIPWMVAWFAARESVFPGSVRACSEEFRVSDLANACAMPERYSASKLDLMLERLNDARPAGCPALLRS
jgi:hypothetical protein